VVEQLRRIMMLMEITSARGLIGEHGVDSCCV
jgi:hypothetical protein